MSLGLIALLDDVAAMAKLAAASLDDVSAAAAKASAKAAGVVIDDAAVTPRYVTGLSPDRELPIIARIAIGSLRNKLLMLLPAALLLSAFAPWALTPLLMLGGAYLCFEGAEKLIEAWLHHAPGESEEDATEQDPAHIERDTISGAIRTDFILSAEIMAIALASVAQESLLRQAIVLVVVSLFITVAVYGVVALIVKLDDIGLKLCQLNNRASQAMGSALVHAMPRLLAILTVVGTAAMLWVGGGIIVHGLEYFHISFPGHQIEALATTLSASTGALSGAIHWLIFATGSLIVGLMLGSAIAFGYGAIRKH
jgi:uncharacterized protein